MVDYFSPEIKLKYQGVIDFEKFYNHIFDFYQKRNYTLYENKWSEKEATPQGREIKFEVIAEREVSEMARYYHIIKILALDAHFVDIKEPDGIKRKMHMRFSLTDKGRLDWDWQGLGNKHHKLQEFFDKYIFKKEREDIHLTYLRLESQEFIDSIKEFLKLEASKVL